MSDKTVSRRRFLQGIGAAAATLVTGCRAKEATHVPELTPTPEPPPTATPTPTATRTSTSYSPVAIAQANSYDGDLVRRRLEALLDGLGGLGDVVDAGDRVAIKVNLTGGISHEMPGDLPATESYVTHPEVVRALGELLRDAGAGELFVVEAVYEWGSYQVWGYEEVAEAIDATLIDLNHTEPYGDFASTPVDEEEFIYEDFVFNHILEEIDAFVSVAKMKCHWCAGVTHAMKNLIGLVPVRYYRRSEGHNHRSAFHGSEEELKARLPRVIVDLNRARPIHLALIDGVKTTEAGEGPWIEGISPVQPGVLVAGEDPVAADAVATAAMGFDPTIDYPQAPFLRADNHLNLAYELGLGTNRLDEIKVVGTSIDDARYQFAPCRD